MPLRASEGLNRGTGGVPGAEAGGGLLALGAVKAGGDVVEDGCPAIEHHDVSDPQLEVLARGAHPDAFGSFNAEDRDPSSGRRSWPSGREAIQSSSATGSCATRHCPREVEQGRVVAYLEIGEASQQPFDDPPQRPVHDPVASQPQ